MIPVFTGISKQSPCRVMYKPVWPTRGNQYALNFFILAFIVYLFMCFKLTIHCSVMYRK